jgi:peptide/nickel transport system substrate-binding protein
MVDKWSVSPDNKTWTFTLRDGLEFHDGKPGHQRRRGGVHQALGQPRHLRRAALKRWSATTRPTPRPSSIVLKEPFGLVLEALGKPSSNVPFIMPKRIADTSGDVQIKESIGSGPYVFKADEFRPGERVVFTKNTRYKPRAEAPSGTAGGKNVYVDRVEWLIIRDAQTQMNALLNGEADILEQPAFEQYATLRTNPDIKLVDAQPAGNQFILRFNFLQPPFNNEKVRRAAMLALGQEAFLRTQVGTPGLTRYCKSMFPCGTLFESEQTGDYTGVANPQKAKALLEEAGYKGEPVVLMRPTDNADHRQAAAGGQAAAGAGRLQGRHAVHGLVHAGGAPCQEGRPRGRRLERVHDLVDRLGHPEPDHHGHDERHRRQGLVRLADRCQAGRNQGAVHAGQDRRREEEARQAAQLRAFETVTHVPVGQYNQPAAVRKNVSGLVPAGAQVYWNIKKQ